MSEEETLKATIAGQPFEYKGRQLQTILLIAIALGLAFALPLIWQVLTAHTQDARDANASFTAAVREFTAVSREQTGAMREYTCMARTDFQDKNAQVEYCRRMGR